MSNDPNYRPHAPQNSGESPEDINHIPPAQDPAWEDILEKTQQATADPQMADVFRNFVRSFPDNTELNLEAVVQLVRLILRRKFGNRKLPPECATWIAEVLYYDPTSHQRVKTLWNLARD